MYVSRALDPNNPLGQYTEPKRLVVPGQDFWAIDGTVLQYGNGQNYFIWSGWPTIDAGFPQNLYIARFVRKLNLEFDHWLTFILKINF